MQKPVVLGAIPVLWDVDTLAKRVHVDPESSLAQDLIELVDAAKEIAQPKAIYQVGYIEVKEEASVVIDGVAFRSRVLRVNLEQAHRVFFHVATCGTELHEWALSLDDLLQRYWAESIQVAALGAAIQALNDHMNEQYQLGQTARMSPGSLSDWPLREQRALFAAIGGVTEAIGVRLTESLLMVPAKSVSGIRFPTERSFESCQLCPRESCPGRRAAYDRALAEERYGLSASQVAG